MNVLLCEGKNDAYFFDETMKERFTNQVYTIYNNDLSKLQEMFGTNCYNFVKGHFPLIIYGDGGKLFIKKALRRVIIDTLGKNNDELHIIMILDDGGSPYEELKEALSEELDSLSGDRSKFTTHLPNLENNNDLFILTHPRSRGILKVRLATVPKSLEEQVVIKTVEIKCPHNHELLENEPHRALEILANEYYDGNRERLIRDSSSWLKDEIWVSKVCNIVR